jgi:ribosomal protein S27AE
MITSGAYWLRGVGGRRYDGLAMAETLKCPSCGAATEPDARTCGKCQYHLKSELECLRSIDASVGIMKRILIWWLVVSFLGGVVYIASRLK